MNLMVFSDIFISLNSLVKYIFYLKINNNKKNHNIFNKNNYSLTNMFKFSFQRVLVLVRSGVWKIVGGLNTLFTELMADVKRGSRSDL